VNRGRVVLLAGLVVVTGVVVALQFRKSNDEAIQPSGWTTSSTQASSAPVSSTKKSTPMVGPVPPATGRVEMPTEPQMPTGMSSALAELDRRVFPIGDFPAKTSSGRGVPTAAASTNATPLVELDTSERSHRIADGDTLVRLAERYLGRADRSQELFEYNRDVLSNPDVLPIGKQLRIPPLVPVQTADPLPSMKSTASEPAGTQQSLVPLGGDKPAAAKTAATAISAKSKNPKQRTYEVQAGDNLVDIARKLYGDGRRHEQLFEANRHVLKNPASLKAGMVLIVP
jgi:nucleoid-associated protein YgaU